MKKVLNNYGGAILLYIVLFIGIVAINKEFNHVTKEQANDYQIVALND